MLQCLAAALLAFGAACAPAQVVSVPAAMLNHVEGSAAVSPRGEREWTDARGLRPLARGDRLWTDRDSRAELQAGAHTLRLAGESHLSLEPAPEGTTQLALTQGTLAVHVGRMAPAEVLEIGTPQLALRLRQPGDYRIDADAKAGTTRVTVVSGAATAYGERGEIQEVRAGQRAIFRARALARVPTPAFMAADDFDRWTVARLRGEPAAPPTPAVAQAQPAAVRAIAATPVPAPVVAVVPPPVAAPVAVQRVAQARRAEELRKLQARKAQDERRLQAQRAQMDKRLQARRAQDERKLRALRAADEQRKLAARAAEDRRIAQARRAAEQKRLADAAQRADEERIGQQRREQLTRLQEQAGREEQAQREAKARRDEQAQREAKARREEQQAREEQARREEEAARREAWLRQQQQLRQATQPWRPAPQGVPARRV